jgi:hypothetical protein
VYGLTHLEEWKWEIWEQESRAKRDGIAAPEKHSVEAAPLSSEVEASSLASVTTNAEVTSVEASSSVSVGTTLPEAPIQQDATSPVSRGSRIPQTWREPLATQSDLTPKAVDSTTVKSRPSKSSRSHKSATSVQEQATAATASGKQASAATATTASSGEPVSFNVVTASDAAGSSTSSSTATSSPPSDSQASQSGSVSLSSPPSSPHSSSSSSHSSSSSSYAPASSAIGGESIYRTIMNRLTALESNHTLYSRYVEEQTNAMREMLRRLGEDVGRLEGLGKAQAQQYQKSVRELERQSRGLEMRYKDLAGRVDYLTNEVGGLCLQTKGNSS